MITKALTHHQPEGIEALGKRWRHPPASSSKTHGFRGLGTLLVRDEFVFGLLCTSAVGPLGTGRRGISYPAEVALFSLLQSETEVWWGSYPLRLCLAVVRSQCHLPSAL